jgi:hypothetical protein
MGREVQHPVYEWVKIDLDDAVGFPEYDGTQPCAQIGLEAFYYEHDDEPWYVTHDDRPASMRQLRLPYPNYSRLDASLLQVCHDCPFVAECFSHALLNEEWGFWGGTNVGDRKRLRKKLGIKLSDSKFYEFSDADARALAKIFASLHVEENADGVE